MRLGSGVPVVLVGLVAMLGAAHPIPPCTPVKMDTSGWKTVRFNRRLLFKFPQSFKPGPVITCAGTCRAWIDGDRQLLLATGEHDGFGKDERTAEGYSECVDTLAGTTFLLITNYRPSKYDS